MSYNVLKLIAHENPFSLRKTAPPIVWTPTHRQFFFFPLFEKRTFSHIFRWKRAMRGFEIDRLRKSGRIHCGSVQKPLMPISVPPAKQWLRFLLFFSVENGSNQEGNAHRISNQLLKMLKIKRATSTDLLILLTNRSKSRGQRACFLKSAQIHCLAASHQGFLQLPMGPLRGPKHGTWQIPPPMGGGHCVFSE